MSEQWFYGLKSNAESSTVLSAQVASEIGRNIVAGHFQEGELVADEGALANRFHVSRTVIRDAIKILAGKGLLEARRGIGTRVRPRQQWGLLDDDILAWQQSSPIDLERIQQLMEVRLIVEPKAAHWAAIRATDDDRQTIFAACAAMRDNLNDSEGFVFADASFHRAVLRAAHNEYLSALEGLVFSSLLSSIRLTNFAPTGNADSLPFHKDVYQAIASHNGEKAESLMNNLLNDASQRLQKLSTNAQSK